MGDVIPPVVAKTVTPKWQTNGKTFTTIAIGIVVPKTFRALLRKMVQEKLTWPKTLAKKLLLTWQCPTPGLPFTQNTGKHYSSTINTHNRAPHGTSVRP